MDSDQLKGIRVMSVLSRWLCIFLLSLSLLLSACGLRSVKPEVAEDNLEQELVIAQDFINIMAQMDAFSPWTTDLSFQLNHDQDVGVRLSRQQQRRHDLFGRALRIAATKNGYTTKAGRTSSASHHIRFSISRPSAAVDSQLMTYNLSVGDVDFRRVYKPRDDGGIEPVNAMLIRGATVSQVVSDDSIFEPSASKLSADSVANTNSEERTEFNSPLQKKTQPAPVMQVETPNATGQEESIVASGDIEFSLVPKANVADKGSSNYDRLLVDKRDVAAEVLVFADDSYVLGSENKQLLGSIMSGFNPDTDVVSVVGCSTGVTKIENGNAALAIGRANRVKEALLYSGISHDKIYDEGCWSPEANSTPFPNRGVVITIKRVVEPG